MVLEILALILGSLAHLGALLLFEFAVIVISVIIDWFLEWTWSLRTDPAKLAVTVADDIAYGNVSYVQGIFDTDTEQFTDARRIRGRDADAQVRRAHSTHRVAVWS